MFANNAGRLAIPHGDSPRLTKPYTICVSFRNIGPPLSPLHMSGHFGWVHPDVYPAHKSACTLEWCRWRGPTAAPPGARFWPPTRTCEMSNRSRWRGPTAAPPGARFRHTHIAHQLSESKPKLVPWLQTLERRQAYFSMSVISVLSPIFARIFSPVLT